MITKQKEEIGAWFLAPKKEDKILDPACGTAGFLISSYKHIIKHNSSDYIPEKDKEAFEENGVDISELTTGGAKHYNGDKLTPDERSRLSKNIIGYDISPDMVRLSLVNMYLPPHFPWLEARQPPPDSDQTSQGNSEGGSGSNNSRTNVAIIVRVLLIPVENPLVMS